MKTIVGGSTIAGDRLAALKRGFLAVGQSGDILWVSGDIAGYLGYQPDELIGGTVSAILPDHGAPDVPLGVLAGCLNGSRSHCLSVVARGRDGSERAIALDCECLTGDGAALIVVRVEAPDADAAFEDFEEAVDLGLQRLAQGASLQDALRPLCAHALHGLGLAFLEICTLQPDGKLSVRAGAARDGAATAPGTVRDVLGDDMSRRRALDAGEPVPAVLPLPEDPADSVAAGPVTVFPVVLSQRGIGAVIAPGKGAGLPDTAVAVLDRLTARIGVLLRIADDQSRLKLMSVAIAATANAVYVTGPQGRIEWINAAFSRLSGYSEQEARGMVPRLLRRTGASSAIWDTLAQGRVWRGEVMERHKSGSLLTVDQTITPIIDDAGVLSHCVVVQEDITQRKDAEERLRYLANFDRLTGQPNRLLFMDRLQHAVSLARAEHRQLAVLFIDLSNFNRINDIVGHAAGDQMLSIIADRINKVAVRADTVARVGGDEFAIILRDMPSPEVPALLARNLIDAILEPTALFGSEVHIGANIGISIFPSDSEDPESLIKFADMALYAAVRSAPNSYCFFSPDMNSEAEEYMSLERDMRQSLDGMREFLLYYQPQLDLVSGRITGVEALMRWKHPRRGMVPPGRFIPVAEDSGLIVRMGDWVLREALEQAKVWDAAGLPPLLLAVNLSAVQFQQKDLAQRIAQMLEETGVRPSRLELELTETVIMQDAQQASSLLEDLSDIGVQIAIDDFGTGYSSLNYLKRFPVDRLKIDQSFVRELTSARGDAQIAEAIIQLGHSLDLKVVSEGVENEEQMTFMQQHGCDVVQGFLVARPMPADDIPGFLDRYYADAAVGSA